METWSNILSACEQLLWCIPAGGLIVTLISAALVVALHFAWVMILLSCLTLAEDYLGLSAVREPLSLIFTLCPLCN